MKITIFIADDLLEKIDLLTKQQDLSSRNQFIVEALELKVREIENREIDLVFALMSGDTEYQSETLRLKQEFVRVDREMSAWK